MAEQNGTNTGKCAEEYVVKRGDSFYLIAHKLGVPGKSALPQGQAKQRKQRLPRGRQATRKPEKNKSQAQFTHGDEKATLNALSAT